MSGNVLAGEQIPAHLPRRLTISLWFVSWVTHTQPGECFADLDRAFGELVERGFNTVRLDGLWSWCYDFQGKRRPPVEIAGPTDPGYCDFCPGLNARGGGRINILDRLMELFQAAEKHNAYVALTSWEYQPGHSLGFLADPGIRNEILALPAADRFDYTARQIDRLVREIKGQGFGRRLAYVELHNEMDYSIGRGLPGGIPALRVAAEKAIAFLRQRHPDLLITDDYSIGSIEQGFDYQTARDFLQRLAPNSQLLDHHLYAWDLGIQVDLFRKLGVGMFSENHDEVMRQAESNELYRWMMKPDRPSWHDFKVHFRSDWFSNWWTLLYVYQYMNVDRYDYWMFRHYPEYEERMRTFWRNSIAFLAEYARSRNVPLVCDEGYICWPPVHSEFEPSAVGRANFDYIMDCMIEAGYWGYMVSSYAFPGQPLWEQHADWLAQTHARILKS